MSGMGKVVLNGLSYIVLLIAGTIFLCNGLVLYVTENRTTDNTILFPFISASLVSIST